MVRQPPKLLTRIIRAITLLHEQKGSTVPDIVTQVRFALKGSSTDNRNVAMQVRRALKYAVDNGLVSHRAGKYRVEGRRRVVPVDSLEMAVDCKRRRGTKRKKRSCKCKKKESHHDHYKKRGPKSQQRRKRRRAKSSESQHKSQKSQKSQPVSNTGSGKNVSQQQKQATPSASATANTASRPNSRSDHQDHSSSPRQRRETPYPDSDTDPPETAPQDVRKRSHTRRYRGLLPPGRNQQDEPPSVEEEPMDAPASRLRSTSRNISPKRPSMAPRQRENQDNGRDSDSLDDDHDQPPSYYN